MTGLGLCCTKVLGLKPEPYTEPGTRPNLPWACVAPPTLNLDTLLDVLAAAEFLNSPDTASVHYNRSVVLSLSTLICPKLASLSSRPQGCIYPSPGTEVNVIFIVRRTRREKKEGKTCKDGQPICISTRHETKETNTRPRQRSSSRLLTSLSGQPAARVYSPSSPYKPTTLSTHVATRYPRRTKAIITPHHLRRVITTPFLSTIPS